MRPHLVDKSFLYNNLLLAEWSKHGSVTIEACHKAQCLVEEIERNSLEALKIKSPPSS